MKVKNLNSSSRKTKALIKDTFAIMLAEKKELSKINISELVKRAGINRSTFYAHYDDIYGVAEEYENELVDNFFNNAELLKNNNFDLFIESFFNYIRSNNDNYKMLCKSNEVIFAIRKLIDILSTQLINIYKEHGNYTSNRFVELEINIFVEGTLYEYVKSCRGYSNYNLDDLEDYCKEWYGRFYKKYLESELS